MISGLAQLGCVVYDLDLAGRVNDRLAHLMDVFKQVADAGVQFQPLKRKIPAEVRIVKNSEEILDF